MSDQAEGICRGALAKFLDGHELVGSCVLFSGGNDSTVLAHLMHQRGLATHAVHANTTIGIEETRQFVRDVCSAWDLPLLERRAPVTYEQLVLERGFPGPGMHWKMYTRLKERALDAVRAELVTHPRRQRVLFIAGRRRQESRRRLGIPLYERDGSTIWASPLATWTSLDLNTYRLLHRNVPVNRVSELLHMSGECLCGSFARPHELEELGAWFPEVAGQIAELERRVTAAGFTAPLNHWGHGTGGDPSASGRLCSSCTASHAS